MMARLLLFIAFVFTSLPMYAEPAWPVPADTGQEIVINNRILAKVNGKTISVVDVMKKMDLFISRTYPQYADSKVARYQFYSSQWREMLNQMITTELILADAAGMEFKIQDGEVREEVVSRFGGSVMPMLDKLNLSYDEVRKMVHDEMVVQRMTWYRVNSKAYQKVRPEHIKNAYKAFCAKNPPVEKWKYQVLSLRGGEAAAHLAEKAYAQLSQENRPLSEVASLLKEEAPDMAITVSQEYEADDKTLSKAHQDILAPLELGAYSQPTFQISRQDKGGVYRIFQLKDHSKTATPFFGQVVDQLHEQLLEAAMNRETQLYTAKLRQRFSYDEKQMQEVLPESFEPFALR